MTDTQPTKYCVDCKHFQEYLCESHHCYAPQRKETEPDLVTGTRRYVNGSDPKAVRENECKGEWWEEMPKPEETATLEQFAEQWCNTHKADSMVTFVDGQQPTPRPSIFQRIKRWFG